jgi:PhnB protein
MAKPIPDGWQTVTTNLTVADGAAALDYYGRAFGADVLVRFEAGGKLMHSEMRIGDTRVMVSDELPEYGLRAPDPGAGVTGSLTLYCEDAAAVHARAVAEGATAVAPVEDTFNGDRLGSVLDPFGHRWVIATRVEDVPPEEVQRRMDDWVAQSTA